LGAQVSVDEEAGMCRAVVLGDSGMMLMRPQASGGWAVRYTWHQEREIEGQEQQHYFNCPYQLGVLSGAEVNTPADALEVSPPSRHPACQPSILPVNQAGTNIFHVQYMLPMRLPMAHPAVAAVAERGVHCLVSGFI
jgi:hypothetical protein